MKTCNACLESKPLDEFYTRAGRCKKCHNAYTKQHYLDNKQKYLDKAKKSTDKLKQFVRQAKSVPCADCGKTYPYYVMDFDHLGNKEFNIGSGTHWGLEKTKTEIAKCEVVCSNCHRIRTYNRRAV